MPWDTRTAQQRAHACLCTCMCARARREAGTHAALTGGAAPVAPLHLPLLQTRAQGGPRPERAAERSRAGAAAARGWGWRRRGRERASRRRIREVLELFDSSRRSRTGRGGPLRAQGSCWSPAPGARGEDREWPLRPAPSRRAARVTMLLPQLCWLPLLAGLFPPAPAQKFSALTVSRPGGPGGSPQRGPRLPLLPERPDPGKQVTLLGNVAPPPACGVRAGGAQAGPQAAAWASGVLPPRGGALGVLRVQLTGGQADTRLGTAAPPRGLRAAPPGARSSAKCRSFGLERARPCVPPSLRLSVGTARTRGRLLGEGAASPGPYS